MKFYKLALLAFLVSCVGRSVGHSGGVCEPFAALSTCTCAGGLRGIEYCDVVVGGMLGFNIPL